MDRVVASHKRRQLTRWSAVVGLAIAASFAAYFGIDPRIESPAASWGAVISIFLCPGSLFFVTFIDAESWTNGFFFMWLAIAVINLGVYGAIGSVIGKFLWKSD